MTSDLPKERLTFNFVFLAIGLEKYGIYSIKFRYQMKGILHKIDVVVISIVGIVFPTLITITVRGCS